jgi:hypothetical protein
MTPEQLAEHLHHIHGLLMSLVAEASQFGLVQVVQDLEAARTSVGSAVRRLETPLNPPPARQAVPERSEP